MGYNRSENNASFETDSKFGRLLQDLGQQAPESCAFRKVCSFKGNAMEDRMHESILSSYLEPLIFDGAIGLYTCGQAAKRVEKYDLRTHDRYRFLPELPKALWTEVLHCGILATAGNASFCFPSSGTFAELEAPFPVVIRSGEGMVLTFHIVLDQLGSALGDYERLQAFGFGPEPPRFRPPEDALEKAHQESPWYTGRNGTGSNHNI